MNNQFDKKQVSFRAWIEKIEPGAVMKLHVHGELHVADESLLYQLDRRIPQGYYPEELFLVIRPNPLPGNSSITLKYHENLGDTNHYEKISILSNSGQVFEINEINTQN